MWGTASNDRVFIGAIPVPGYLYLLVATYSDKQIGFVCYADLVMVSAEECTSGGTINVYTGPGNDYVALLYSEMGAGLIVDGDARRVYRSTIADCAESGYHVKDIEAYLGTAENLYADCDAAEIVTSSGNNTVRGTPKGEETVFAGTGSDGIFGNGGLNFLHGGGGNDFIDCGGDGECFAYGEEGEDRLRGTSGLDVLDGGPGSDFIDGRGGDDVLLGGSENDYLFGAGGLDRLEGGEGNDVLSGGLNDTGSPDLFDGGDGTDTFYCRDATNVQPEPLDPAWIDAVEDCAEAPAGLETTDDRDPYLDWVRRFERTVDYAGSGASYHIDFNSTSATAVMLDARAAGATILLQSPGHVAFAGCFLRGETCSGDGLAYFSQEAGTWSFDHEPNGSIDETLSPGFPLVPGPAIRPFVGRCSGDGEETGVGYFDPVERQAYCDGDLDGETGGPYDQVWDLPDARHGDLPVMGPFGPNGEEALLFFRPRTLQWFEVDELGNFDVLLAMNDLGDLYGIPLWVDTNGDGVASPAMYVRDQDQWLAWQSISDPAPLDPVYWHGGRPREYPVIGDLGSGSHADLGLFDPSGDPDVTPAVLPATVVLEQGFLVSAAPDARDLSVDTPVDAQGDGEPLRSRRVQSDWTCGPQSLEMVLRHRGLTEEAAVYPEQLVMNRDLGAPPWMRWERWDSTPWAPPGNWDVRAGGDNEFEVSVGYRYSAEHIVYEALLHMFIWEVGDWPPSAPCDFLLSGTTFVLDNGASSRYASQGDQRRIDYLIGGYDPRQDLAGALPGQGPMQVWDYCSPGVGWHVGDEGASGGGRLLPGVANRANQDALRPLDARVVSNGMFDGVDHYRAVVAAFVDHDIPLVVGVERGGHFNTVVGYWDLGSVFYLYTAEPLDGFGRPDYARQPMRWQRFAVTEELLSSRIVTDMMIFDHTEEGACSTGGWAWEIDDTYGPLLCGYM